MEVEDKTEIMGDTQNSIVIEEDKQYDEELVSGQELPFSQTSVFSEPKEIPREFSQSNTNLFKRKTTRVTGISGANVGSGGSEYRELRKRMKMPEERKSVVQRIDWALLRITMFVAKMIDKFVPSKFNPVQQETSETLWMGRIRRNMLDKGKHKRRFVTVVTFLMLSLFVVVMLTSVPWRSYAAMDVLKEAYIKPDGEQGETIIVRNLLMPHYLDPRNDPSDRVRLEHLVDQRHIFDSIVTSDLKRDYKEVKVQYKEKVNVSFSVLQDVMKAVSEERNLPCICAAHVGVPLNVVYLNNQGFMNEPTMTLGTKDLRISPVLKNANLYYNASLFAENRKSGIKNTGVPPEEGFRIMYPKAIAFRFLTPEGFKSREAYTLYSACVVFCAELAKKKPLVGPPSRGGVLTSQEGNVKHYGIL